jgi:hypothetical protein
LRKLVGWHVEPIRWAPPLGGGVFEDNKLALTSDGVSTAGGDLTPGHLNKTPDTVSVVDHVIPGSELQGVHHFGALGSQCSP